MTPGRSIVGPVSGQSRDKLVPLRQRDKMYNGNVTWDKLATCPAPCHLPYFTSEDLGTSVSQSFKRLNFNM